MSRVPLLLVACAAALCPAGSALSQEAERVFQPGEVVKTGIGQTVKILQCRPERVSRETECAFVLWKNGGAASIKNWMNAAQIAAGEARVKEAEELAALSDAPPAPASAPAPGAEALPPATDPGAPQ
ncbi:hypothetical protein [Sphingomonas sp. M1-B02]|uniref:hypothetical protein n=1 Tax=Sphingomonas sp. M1-B02 TaxID=3114300 RepID=UPI002240D6E4|nr:hypothetical protein [Sphingomonas sp. S6-11]UZK66675.1 hypothetical protein OKW87_02215 [Sphingomonas sp. S6-11]